MILVVVNSPLKVLSNTSEYPNIPQTLIDYTRQCLKEGITSRYINVISTDTVLTIKAIDDMFARSSMIAGLSPETLFEATDFHPNDLDPHRIEAAFAEIRAISFLAKEGFSDIRPLPAANRKEADFLARYGKYLYAIEVADSVFDAANRNSPDELIQWATNRAIGDKKLQQIEQTMGAYGCSKGVFVFAVDTQGPTIWLTRPDFISVAKSVWRELGPRCNLHIGAFTGRVTFGNIPDDVMYPEASQRLIRCLWNQLRIFLGLGI